MYDITDDITQHLIEKHQTASKIMTTLLMFAGASDHIHVILFIQDYFTVWKQLLC